MVGKYLTKSLSVVWMVLALILLSCGKSTECNPDDTKEVACGSDVGACRAGWKVCKDDGTFSECVGSIESVAEECDGVDNDCNGQTDELTRSCQNDCGQPGTESCVGGEWFCDVLTPLEGCADEIDNDCDGSTDEGCNCTVGFVRSCGTDVGTCVAGTQHCKDGYWTNCEGAIGPEDEVCDALDNDCDGETDEELERPCQAPCGPGIETCIQGQWVNCTTDIVERPCYSACGQGSETCVGGVWGSCSAPQPEEEILDGLDNDCDTLIDENLYTPGDTIPCGSGVGECVPGTQTYQEDGTWSPCEGAVGPSIEIDDELDNDCDGLVDDGPFPGDVQGCGSGAGECVEGTQTFQEDGTWSPCEGAIGPSQEISDGLDNDCDGQVDECPLPGCTQPCGFGVCAGTQTFQEDFTWGPCQGGQQPSNESCDGLDNDCNGWSDDNVTRPCSGFCGEGLSYCQGGSFGTCQVPVVTQPCVDECGLDGTKTCSQSQWSDCVSSAVVCYNQCNQMGFERCINGVLDCSAPPVSNEMCNGLDDDCDDQTDELWPDKGKPCTATQGLCTVQGVLVCNAMQNGLRCDAQIEPQDEECDGQDNDCDGSVDEALTRDCNYECQDENGTIRPGNQNCQGGIWTPCSPEIPCPH